MTPHLRSLTVVVSLACAAAALAIAPAASASSCGIKSFDDGTTGPVLCKDGTANAAVKAKLKQANPAIMALGAKTSMARVKKAVCTDIARSKATYPMVDAALAWQTAALGWPKSYEMWFTNSIVSGSGSPGC